MDQPPTKSQISPSERSRSEDPLKSNATRMVSTQNTAKSVQNVSKDGEIAPPIPPLPTNYQRSDGTVSIFFLNRHFFLNINEGHSLLDESCSASETREQRKSRAHSRVLRQAELKR